MNRREQAAAERVDYQQQRDEEPLCEICAECDDKGLAGETIDASFEPVGPQKRIKHLSALLSEAVEIIEADPPELGSDEWVWLIQAAAAFSNKCVLCGAGCDEEGECVSPDCCFGRSKLAQQAAMSP